MSKKSNRHELRGLIYTLCAKDIISQCRVQQHPVCSYWLLVVPVTACNDTEDGAGLAGSLLAIPGFDRDYTADMKSLRMTMFSHI
jgi:hypothetical protein